MGQYMAGVYSAGLAKVASFMAAGVAVQAGAFSSSRSPADGSKKHARTLIIRQHARVGQESWCSVVLMVQDSLSRGSEWLAGIATSIW